MVSKAIYLLKTAKQSGIHISVDKGVLSLKMPGAKEIDPQLLQEIKDNKAEIIEFLSDTKWRSNRVNGSENYLVPFDRRAINKISLSFGQERLWFIDQLEGSIQYHIPAVLRLNGKLNTKGLEYALQTIVERHESLRSVIYEEKEQAYQQVMDAGKWEFLMIDGSAFKDNEQGLQQCVYKLISEPFDLSKDYMLRATLVSLRKDEHILVVVMHHIAADGWSVPVIIKEVAELYLSFIEGRSPALAPLKIQYADYAVWQRNYLQGTVLESKLDYWIKKLKNVPALELPADYTRPLIQSTRGATINFTIQQDLADKVRLLSNQEEATLFMTLLAVFKVLLFRYSGQQDICVGTPIAGRQQAEVEGLIGFFVNTLALNSELSNEISFKKLIREVRKNTIDAYEHQEIPFEKVVEAVVKDRDMSRSPLFQVMFVMQNKSDTQQLTLPGLTLSLEKQVRDTSKFDINFIIADTPEGFQGSIEYCTDLFKEQTIVRMIGHYKLLLKAVVAAPDQLIGLLPILSAQEEQQLITGFNDTTVPFPKYKSITNLFEEQVKKTPDHPAVCFGDEQITYQVLNERTNRLAHYLRSKGVKADTLVPLFIDRSMEMVIAVIAILKAGAAYVPLDPEYPAERILYMIEDVKAELILTTRADRPGISAPENVLIVEVDGDWEEIKKQPVTNPEVAYLPRHLAYLLYTSGSTGRPKGVKMPGQALVNLLNWQQKQFTDTNRRVLQYASLNFDASFLEIFSTLCYGCTLYLIEAERRKDVAELLRDIVKYEITHLYSPYIVLKNIADNIAAMPDYFFRLQEIIVAGEQLKINDEIRHLLKQHIGRIVNQYGPTEAHVVSSFTLDSGDYLPLLPPIGKPVDNTQLYILSPIGQLVPVGVAGEVYIGGVQVADGYLNQPELTGEKFIKDFFSPDEKAMLYRTGDIARWLPDGNVDYLGRKDEQVKIRGFRVELGEIENVLQQCSLVSQAVVLAKDDHEGNKRLIGYIVAEGEFDKQSIVAYLKDKLPAYMIPGIWVAIDEIPVTTNGKVNRKALPDPGMSDLATKKYVAPRNKLEEKLVAIWQRLLGMGRIGIEDNFFEMGGHSLLATRVVSAIRSQLHLEVALKDLFVYPDILALSDHLRLQGKGVLMPGIIAGEPRPDHIPLSFSQERLWFIDRLKGSIQYHLPSILRLKGELNKKALEQALQYIVSRHEILRTVIVEKDDTRSQVIREWTGWNLAYTDVGGFVQDKGALTQYIDQLIKAPFDLSCDYMLRANLVRLSNQDHLLVTTMHHIASDGWSISIIVKEFTEAYASFSKGRPVELKPLSIQYADYAIWQREYLQGKVLDEKLSYWKEKLEGVTTLELPLDFERPAIQSIIGASTKLFIDKALTEKLNLLSSKQGTTLFMTLLTIFKLMLHRYSGQDDICVGTPIAGRNQMEVESLIGLFINTLALRSNLGNNPSFTELLQQVKAVTLEAYENQEVPFEKVVEIVGNERDMSRNPLFQVLLTMQNTPEVPKLRLDDLTLSIEEYEHGTSQLDIICNITETTEGLQVSVAYCTDLFTKQTMDRMMFHFRQLLVSVVQSPHQKIGLLPMLTEQEKHQLVVEFNGITVHRQQKTIVTLFEEQVEKTPENIAVVFQSEQLTYSQLNERANRLAWHLKSRGVKPEEMVPVCLTPGPDMLVGILGILKAGAAYVPIDPQLPEERINYLLRDTVASFVISNRNGIVKLPQNPDLKIILVDEHCDVISRQSPENLQLHIGVDQLAYIIYTSGSTGKPKGVMVEHKSLCNYLVNNKTCYINEETGGSGSFLHLSYTFDASLTAMFMPLISGKSVVISSRHSADLFEDINLEKYAPYDFIKITPSHLPLLQTKMRAADGTSLTQKLVIGGEALFTTQFKDWMKEGLDITVINEYGPTEATVGCSVYSFKIVEEKGRAGNSISIGKPIDNTEIYILGNDGALLPIGARGELCIGGAGVARGYLNLADLTAENFISNRFGKEAGSKLYKTGDVASWSPDGNINYLGRKDEQVKIRGYRVELGEIESVMQECITVRQAVVVVRESKEGIKFLVGYFVADEGCKLEEVQSYLKAKLPEYMVPVRLIKLEQLPLTSNGKVDRNSLPDPDTTTLPGDSHVAPRNNIEEVLAAIWRDVLEVDEVGVESDFFDLGGHSLLAIRLISLIRKKFQVEMQISDIFNYPTIALLSEQLSKTSDTPILPPIQAVNARPDHIPLSFSQERLWFIDQLEGSLQYHVPAVLRLKGKLNTQALTHSLQQIINRHEVLRTVIYENEGRGYQYINGKDEWRLYYTDGKKYAGHEEALQQKVAELINTPFDLSKDHMLRANLIGLHEEEYILILTLHHIASDGWSVGIIVKELVEFWMAFEEKRVAFLPELPLQYADFAIWQKTYLQGKVLESKLSFWKENLKDVQPIQLPIDYVAPLVQSTRGAAVPLYIDYTITKELQNLSRQAGASLFMTLLAAFKILLSRHSGQVDICVGTPISGRQQQEMELLIGFFLNTIAVRSEIDPTSSFNELLQQIRNNTLNAYAHQEVPFEKVVEAVVKERSISRSPLFQVLFIMQNIKAAEDLRLGGVELFNEPNKHDTTKFEMTLNLTETDGVINGSVEYCVDLYKEETIVRMIGHYKELLKSIVKTPNRAIGLLPMLSTGEEQQLFTSFNNTLTPFPREKSIVALFEEQVLKTPDVIALCFGTEWLSYKALNERANQLAHLLRANGVKEETLVPVCVERSIEMVISVIAILKAGGAYVPLDPDYPQERISYMIKDANVDLILTTKSNRAAIQFAADITFVEIDAELKEIEQQPKTNLSSFYKPDHLAYLIYTSGSTGRPKGVKMPGQALVNLLSWQEKQFTNKHRRVLQFASLNFDVSFQEIFSTLCFGSTLYLIDGNRRKDVAELLKDIVNFGITHLFVPYIVLKNIADNILSMPGYSFQLEEVIVAGEQLKLTDEINFLLRQHVGRIVNQYGPTEAHVVSSFTIEGNGDLPLLPPIGKPIDNTRLYIVGNGNQLQPIGVAGELCIGGVQVAQGYLNQDDQTADKFIKDFFSRDEEARLYKTGDMARWLADGNIEYLGRKDEQVKIRGYRVELGEIENVLQECTLVRQAVVLAKEDHEGNKRLIGYIVAEGTFDHRGISNYVKEKLPAYMIPGLWVEMDALPVTNNGKLDRKALPDPDTSALTINKYVAPRNVLEEKIADIWKNLLGLERVGIEDNFFEIGGHSLLATRVVSAIRSQLQLEVAIKDLFVYPTIATLADQLRLQGKGLLLPKIEVAIPRPEHIPLSFSQERLWFIDQLEGSLQYHVPAVLRLKGSVNTDALSYSFKMIIRRHETLRTVFLQDNGQAYQQIRDQDDWVMSVIDGSALKADINSLPGYVKEIISEPFNLSKDYMYRAHLIRLDENDNILVVTMHHIAADGWSTSILVKELMELYKAYVEGRDEKLATLPIQFSDYAIWQRNYLQGPVFNRKIAYWKTQMQGVATLQLPTDFSRPPVWSTRGALEYLVIDKELLNKLHELSRRRSSTLFMTLLAAFKMLLFRYTGQKDICIGTPIAGRQQHDLEGLIGFFVNSLPLRTQVSEDDSFTELLQKVHCVTMEAYENQEVPFERIVDEVVSDRDISRNPLFQVMLVMLNMPVVPVLQLDDLTLSREDAEHTTAKFDLQVFFTEKPEGLSLLTEYCSDLFTSATIKRMMCHYVELLKSVVNNPHEKINNFSMLTQKDEHELLVELNNTQVDYPKNRNVIDLFEAQVFKTPFAIAAIFGGEQLTYNELNEQANKLAHHLINMGMQKEALIPILLERSLHMIVAIWGILKAGAAYVPVDPEYPEERIHYIIEDTAAAIILTNQKSINKISHFQHIYFVDLDNTGSLSRQPIHNPGLTVGAGSLAYVIYTSGSTGKPKGVMNEHGGLANRLFWAQDYFRLDTRDVVLQKTTFCFDVSVWELLWPSLVGARLVFAKPGGQRDNAYLISIIEETKVTIIHFVPSMLEVFLPDVNNDNCITLKKVLCSGEALKSSQVELFKERLPGVELYNLYGPTEAAIDVTCWTLADKVENSHIVPIGKPISNTAIYILNENGVLAPKGGIGEIHIGGIQVARGYLNRPELTEKNFIENIFDETSNSKLYKTGDLGRWMLSGDIEYLGRIDDQVKIRGYRIELGEIETILQDDKSVRQAVVLAKTEKNGHARLISYYTPDWQSIRAREKELYMDRVENWKELYNTEYEKAEEIEIDEEFNLIGWNSSFTGDAIPEVEMREWVEDITTITLSHGAESVLEIGCGTGLIYYSLAGKLKKYIGTDLSQTSITQITERIKKQERYYGPTELRTCAAHEVVLYEGIQVDTIVLNSIIQYFPGEGYLDTVIDKCIDLLSGNGRIIIGDVRDYRLLNLFRARLQVDTLQNSQSIQELRWAVEQDMLKENELCVDPAYFIRLKSHYPAICHIELRWKVGDYINELSLYRYTVVIYLGNQPEISEPVWQRWEDVVGSNVIAKQLESGLGTISIKDAPNPRLWKEQALKKALDNQHNTTVGDLFSDDNEQDIDIVQINEIIKAATAKGYNYTMLLNEDPLKVNIVLELGVSEKLFSPEYALSGGEAIGNLTNIPLFIDISRLLQKDIRATLQKKLPEYMIPGEIIPILQIPLTMNGKVDRKFLTQREEKSIINASAFIPPSTLMEHQLVGIWKELLGIEQVGIEENFFELGGDSILTIQIVSRLRTLGYELQPKDIFIHQTIGKLSAAIAERSGSTVIGEQGILSGFSGLLPIQQWHLNGLHSHHSHFNQAVFLGLNKNISRSVLEQAIDQLVERHDALRFKYFKQDSRWLQEYGSQKGHVVIEDLQEVPEELLASTITKRATAWQQSLNIEAGELIRVVWMQTPATETNNRLLIVIHHLATDGVSWRILLEDLELLLTTFTQGEKLKPVKKSSSYRQWYQALEKYGKRNRLTSQLNYWHKAVENYRPLPFDKIATGTVVSSNIVQNSNRLDAKHTSLLLQEVPRIYHTEINDILLAALVDTLCSWSGLDTITIGLEGHGREDIDSTIDITRTVGWLTSLYPLRLAVPTSGDETSLIQSVKEQLRQVPDKGLGYGVLKYINNETSLFTDGEPWDIIFNYLGQLDKVVRKSKWLSGAHEPYGPLKGEDQVVTEKMLVNCSVSSGELIIHWSFSNKHFNEETINILSKAYLTNLKRLIAHCIEQQKTGGIVYTPSDYGLGSEVRYEELNLFLSEKVGGKERRTLIEGLYRLSGLQEGMLFHGLYDTGVGAYTEQFACDLSGVDLDNFRMSWAHLVKRHSVLRSAFHVDAFSVPVQCVYKDIVIPLAVRDIRQMDEEEQAAAIKEFDKEDWDKGFDFKAAPLMRLGLLRLSNDKYRMLWTSHHILFDGWSFPILMEEFLSIYESLSMGTEVLTLPEDRYEDYIRYIERSEKEKEEEYWRNYLESTEQNTLLPFVDTTMDRNKGLGSYHALEMNLVGTTAKSIHSFAKQNRITLNTLMQGVWAYLLHQYTGHKNIVYGIIVSGRPEDLSGVEKRVGMYINTLPLCTAINHEEAIIDWLKTIQSEQVNSRQHQHTPFSMVQGWSNVQGDLFDTLLTFENYPFNKVFTTRQWTLEVTNVKVNDHTNYPLSIIISSAENINIRFSYNSMLLNGQYVHEIRDHFENVLLQILDNPKASLKELQLLTVAEQNKLLTEFNNTGTRLEIEETFVGLFEKQVVKTPNALAAVFANESITFNELNARSNQLAHYLKSMGVNSEMLVPVCIDTSVQMLISILGILKAGAAYVPIDPGFPGERVTYILEDTAALFAVTENENAEKLIGSTPLNIIQVDTDWEAINKCSTENLPENISGHQLAYIIYTSGSTGKPKGVMIEHRSLVNYLVNSGTKYINAEGNSTGSFIHLSYTFDASITAMFMPLLSGKAVVIGSKQSIDVFEDSNLLKYAPYDFIKITPSHLEILLPAFKAFANGPLAEKLVIGGEALYAGQFSSYISEGVAVEIINEYGPTEATVGCTTYSFDTLKDKEKIKKGIWIGKPIDNVSIYILNDTGNLVPAGVRGEICIGGAGVARGYLNRNELTAEKFITKPVLENSVDKIYRTGDIGRWLPDGNIEYLGRMDDQLKIRGYRIEPGEIEAELQKCEEVTQGVVIAKYVGEGDKRLVGYYVPDTASVKSRERELQYQRVASWKELYETEYGQTEDDENIDPEFNIIGWNDSFTGDPILGSQMKEWLDDIVNVVLSENAGNVLEIGCGTGLIYYQLAGKVDKYIGTDLSQSSINQIKKRISKGLRNYGQTELFTAPAHEVNLKEDQEVDTILLNSMIQYFPGENYLNSVIDKCFALVKGKGRIIIGDVRDNRLLESFKGRLRLQKSQDTVSVKDLKWGIEQDLLQEEELCVSPAYFYGLKDIYPQITHIEVQWKQGDYINELTLYRYTVILYVGINKPQLKPDWKSWNDIEGKKCSFKENYGHIIAIKDIPNPRLQKERTLQQALQNASLKTVGDFTNVLDKEDYETAQIQSLLNDARLGGYSAKFLLHEDPLMMNLVFEDNLSNAFVHLPHSFYAQYETDQKANIPLFTEIGFLLQKDIRSTLLKSLPDYMVPAEFFILRQLPLTSNGKVDRIFLRQVEEKHFTNALNYLAPSTDLEKSVAEIWKNLLHLEKVGIEDSFFDIGGHSLLAMRVISAIRKQLQVELNIKDLFLHPTIQLLSAHIQKLTKGLNLPVITRQSNTPVHIPLSFSQERLWFIDQLGGSLQYHIPAVLRLKGRINIAALSGAMKQIVNRHEVLRTVILQEDGTGYQSVKDWEAWELRMTDGTHFKKDPEALQQYIKSNIETPFNLSADYMLRAMLISLDEEDHVLAATLHHIASDGWSTSIMVSELAELYNSYIEGREANVPILPVQYADYAIWQRRYLQGEAWEKKLGYWQEKLQDVAALELPTDYPRPLVQGSNGAITGFRLNKDLSAQLQALSQQHGATLFMTMLAAFNVLLYRYTGQQDICVGTPIAGRQQAELEGLIGFFVNTLALRTEVDGNSTFLELLQKVRATTLEAYDHQEVPFEKVVELVVKERDMSRSPLFQVMFALQNTPEADTLPLKGIQVSREAATEHNTSKFDITFVINETVQGLYLSVEYCTDLFSEATIGQMAAHFSNLLQSLTRHPDQSIGRLSMLDKAETQHLLKDFNNTQTVFSNNRTVVELFEEQVSKSPEATALTFGSEQITYRQLNEKANRVAHYLKEKGVQQETLVPVCMVRSARLVTAMLGILKAGGAYVPIDPDYPEERISFMLEDTEASLLLTSTGIVNRLPASPGIETIDVEEAILSLTHLPANNPISSSLHNLAYVIYTSGSTGRPKGVMIEHQSLTNLITWHNQEYEVSEASCATAMAGVGFDAFGWEVWPYLSCGASLCIVTDEVRLDPNQMEEVFTKNKITHSFIATALVQEFVKQSANKHTRLQYLLTGGDKLPPIDTTALSYKMVNNYGPTENTVVATNYVLEKKTAERVPPIGKPISNTVIYILNDQDQVVPAGVAGELCIGGASLARGYLNRAELTAAKFIPDPYDQTPGARIYKSGDLCRWQPDGNIEYLGRKDEQVKIRGYRIELGEIESVAQQSGLAVQTVVLAKDDKTGNRQLTGYLVPAEGYSKEALLLYLTQRLPVYMVPQLWKELQKMPLTANGKVDRKSLPPVDGPALSGTPYVAPRTETEEKLASIWQDLLGIEKVGINDNFFELGGHSLMAMRMVTHIEKSLFITIPIKALFQFTSISDLSKYLALQSVERPGENIKVYKVFDV